MAVRNVKTTQAKDKVEYEKTNYWLNIPTPVGKIGLNLVKGFRDHEKMIALIEQVKDTDKLNTYLESKGFGFTVAIANDGNIELESVLNEINSL